MLAVRLISNANLGTLSGNQTVDGKTTAPGDLVLLMLQTTKLENGLYVARAGAWERFSDSQNQADTPGKRVMATDGTVNQWKTARLLKPSDSVNQANAELWIEEGGGRRTAGAPGSTEDANSGYYQGFVYLEGTNVHVCRDATVGAAFWVDVTA